MNWRNPQSGTLAVDYYRESKGQEAMHALDAGRSTTTVSGDHLNANELCIEVISRLHAHRPSVSDASIVKNAIDAVNNLRAGNGYHKKQSDHSGGNTCAAVIAAATG